MNATVARRRQTKAAIVTDFRRAQILDAARRTFARVGLEGTTVDHIARTARMAKGTVYLYFRSKDEILRHSVDEGLAELGRLTVPAIAAPGPLEDRLRAFFQAMFEFFDRHRSFIDLCQVELGADMRRSTRQTFGQVYAAQTRAWESALAAAVRERAVARVSVRPTALALVAFAHGLAVQRLRGWSTSTLDADVAHATALVWKGLSVR